MLGKAKQDTVADVANQGLDAVEDKVMSGLDATRKATEHAVEQGVEMQRHAEDKVNELSQSVAAYVQEKPLQAAGIAFAAGIFATLLLSRK